MLHQLPERRVPMPAQLLLLLSLLQSQHWTPELPLQLLPAAPVALTAQSTLPPRLNTWQQLATAATALLPPVLPAVVEFAGQSGGRAALPMSLWASGRPGRPAPQQRASWQWLGTAAAGPLRQAAATKTNAVTCKQVGTWRGQNPFLPRCIPFVLPGRAGQVAASAAILHEGQCMVIVTGDRVPAVVAQPPSPTCMPR